VNYAEQAFDCLAEHVTRFRRLSPEAKRLARSGAVPRLDDEIRAELDRARAAIERATDADDWREVVRCALDALSAQARLDLIAEVIRRAPESKPS
jgi:aminoglycoside phosphotransferase family enzyme